MITPSVDFNFTTAILDARIGFSRSGNTATVVDSSGYVSPINADLPRFDYDPISLVCKGLLIEETRTNIFTYSADFLNTATAGSSRPWVWSNSSVVINPSGAPNSPDNTANTNKLIENTANSTHLITHNVLVTAGTTYTASVFAAAAEREAIYIALSNSALWGGTLPSGIVNLSTGAVSSVSANATFTVTEFQNGFCRITITATCGTSGTSGFQIYLRNNANTYLGNGSSGVYLWGAQLEALSFATSYIPTTTTAVTRNDDVATITGTNFSDWWQASKGGAQVQVTPSTVSGIRPLVQFDDNTANEIIALRGNTTNPELQIVDGGTPQATIDAGTIAANTPYSLTGWWDANDCKARKDSGAVVADTTATIPTVTQMRIGSDGTNYLNGTIATINYYNTFFGQLIYTRRKNKVFSSLL